MFSSIPGLVLSPVVLEVNGLGPQTKNENIFSMIDLLGKNGASAIAGEKKAAKKQVKILLQFLRIAWEIAQRIFAPPAATREWKEKVTYFIIAFLFGNIGYERNSTIRTGGITDSF